MVELSEAVGGPVIDSYVVQDKVQEAELDPSMIMEDELFAVDTWEPCMVCGAIDHMHETMYCDGCDRAVHVFCIGVDDTPDVWYCDGCLTRLELDGNLGSLGDITSAPRSRRPRSTRTRGRRRGQDNTWARVWQEVSQRLDLDLDFPFDDESVDGIQRTAEQQRELRTWQERLRVANRQGNSNRFRDAAAGLLRRPPPAHPPQPESQEELRAWNAFDKARELDEAPILARRKRKSATASPAPLHEPAPEPPRPLKRPRLRQPNGAANSQPAPESSNTALQRTCDGPSFLSSLLKEVEEKSPMPEAGSPDTSDYTSGQQSPCMSSPAVSPTSSGFATPRAQSVTPPPMSPVSPYLLSSTIQPPISPTGPTFSPFSPADTIHDPPLPLHIRGRGRMRLRPNDNSPPYSPGDRVQERACSLSPMRNMSYTTKTEIQRMVKLSLGSRYRNHEVTKDQYTDINRDVSRKLYEMVGHASALADQAEREKWQKVADDEVKLAISAVKKDVLDPDA